MSKMVTDDEVESLFLKFKELTDLNPDFFAGKELLMNLTMESLKEHEHSAWVYYMKVKKVMDFRKLEE